MILSKIANFDYLFFFHLIEMDEPEKLLMASGSGRVHDSPTVSLPDCLFFYMLDTWRWIPTRFAAMDRFPFERPVIASEGAAVARSIFSAWKQLFSAGSEDLALTINAGPSTTPALFKKADLVSRMTDLERFADEVEGANKIIYCSDSPNYKTKKGTTADQTKLNSQTPIARRAVASRQKN